MGTRLLGGAMDLDARRYPVGEVRDEAIDEARLGAPIDEMAALRGLVRRAVDGWGDERLDRPYREGGWTVRQLLHHLPDSHMHAYVRMKLALTQSGTGIMTYDEKLWSGLPDARSAPVDMSLALLEALYERWTTLLRAYDLDTLRAHNYRHPELGVVTVDRAIAMYAWHG